MSWSPLDLLKFALLSKKSYPLMSPSWDHAAKISCQITIQSPAWDLCDVGPREGAGRCGEIDSSPPSPADGSVAFGLEQCVTAPQDMI